MAKQLGRAMVLRADVSGTQTAIATLNSKTLTINNSPIDVTTPDAASPGGVLWQASMAGLKSISISADGVFSDSAVEQDVAEKALSADPTDTYELLVPDFGTYKGKFRIESLEFGGETEGAVTFSISLTSTGAVTWTTV